MANSGNTLWLVSCVIFESDKSGATTVNHCDSRAYRLERNARGRFDSVLYSLLDHGYSIIDRKQPLKDNCDYVQCRKMHRESNYNAVVYIDRNPSWSPN